LCYYFHTTLEFPQRLCMHTLDRCVSHVLKWFLDCQGPSRPDLYRGSFSIFSRIMKVYINFITLSLWMTWPAPSSLSLVPSFCMFQHAQSGSRGFIHGQHHHPRPSCLPSACFNIHKVGPVVSFRLIPQCLPTIFATCCYYHYCCLTKRTMTRAKQIAKLLSLSGWVLHIQTINLSSLTVTMKK
jgi:hypothetical protein